MKKILAVVLAIAIIVVAIPFGAITVSSATSGTTGDCKWQVNGNELTISGNGKMADYSTAYLFIPDRYVTKAPWGYNITKITIENGVTYIGVNAFYGCWNIETISLPDSVTYIAENAFRDCRYLANVDMSDSVVAFGNNAFAECPKLKNIGDRKYGTIDKLVWRIIDSQLKIYGEGDIPNYSTAYLFIPDRYVTKAPWGYGISKIIIAEDIKKIGSNAFYGSKNLETVVLPNTLIYIGESAFGDCTGLTDVYYSGTKEEWNNLESHSSSGNTYLFNATIHYNSILSSTGVFENYVISVVYDNGSFISDVTVGGKKYELSPNYRLSISQAESYKGKNVVITLKDGKVTNIDTDGNYESQVSNWFDLSTAKTPYNATSYSKTAESEVKATLENYLQKMKDYFKALNTETGACSVDINNLIGELKQDKKALFNLYNKNDLGGDVPYKVREAAYYGIANFIKDYADKNQLTLSIDPNKEDVFQAFSAVNQLLGNISSLTQIYEYNGYKITVKNALLVSTAFTGNITVEKYNGKNCIESYSGQIVSDEETAKKAISSYVQSLNNIVEQECKYAVSSLYKQFSNLTGLDEVSEEYLKDIISNDVNNLLKKHKLGDVLKTVIAIQKGYKVVQDCTTLKTINDFEKLYRDTKTVSFDINVKDEIVKKTVSSIKEAKKDLVNALYNYLYHTNTGDPDYWTFQQKFANPKVYLKSLIQCPVEFEIYDENDNLIGYVDSSDEHEEYIWFDESIFIAVDGDIKTIYIPKDMETTINFKPTSNGFLNYSLAEIQNGQETGKLEYFNVPLNVGNDFSQTIPENAEISVDSSGFDLLGDAINECGVYYSAKDNASIKVEVETSLHGQIAGTGEYPIGELVELYAFPDDGYKFLGWYVDDVCVSEDCVYKFTGMEDIKLVALFGDADLKNFISAFEFDKRSLVLSGELGLNFYTKVLDISQLDGAYMEFTVSGKDGETTRIDFVDMKPEEDGRYKFTCYVNVLQMAETVTAAFHYGNTAVVMKTSVLDYINAILDKYNGDDTNKTVKLVKAIANYGYYAQLALAETHGFTIKADGTGDYAEMTHFGNAPDINVDLSKYDMTIENNIAEITKIGRSLGLDSETDIFIYFTVTNGYVPNITVTDILGERVDGVTVILQNDGRYKLDIPNISAHKLGDNYTISIDNGAMTIKLSALSYAYAVLNSTKTDTYKRAVTALYQYNMATLEYRDKGEK